MRALLLLLMLSPLAAVAAEPESFPPAPPPPPPPASVPNADTGLEPHVEIIQRGGDTIEQYSINGQIYMVKITPRKGPPYYLIDTNGDGMLETFRNDVDDPLVQQWILFRW